ncbi:MAG: tetratricopeptide repeat-containing sensor histidine kinase [Bacteroidia bacterium]
MNNHTQRASRSKSLGLLSLMLFVFISGCKKPTSNDNLKQIDDVLALKETRLLDETYLKNVDSVRSYLDDKDVKRISQVYKIKLLHFQAKLDYPKADIYADSLLHLFSTDKLISKNKELYFNALLLKGDAVYLLRKFSQAVLHYLEARSFREKHLDVCFNKELAVRIGNVYYVQHKFAQAASYYKESYALQEKCPVLSDTIKHFYDIQALLNNTGFCYERVGMLDSAQYFYQKDLDYISLSSRNKAIPSYAIIDASAIALDNLGSIYLKMGDLAKAEELLVKSTSLKYSGGDQFKIPPLIKLANLYTLKGVYVLAEQSFSSADSLLKLTPASDLRARLLKYKSEYNFKRGNFKLAYNQMQEHLRLETSINKDQEKLASIDVEKDFVNLAQKYHLQDLEKKSAAQTLYLIFAGFFLFFVIIIAILLYRNTKQAKRNHLITKLHNEELKEALLKLEEANKNYVRVMKIMAHDLRNPLSGISGISSMLLTNAKLVEDERDSLALIKASADHATVMINELLNSVLNNIEDSKIEKESFDIRILVYQCVSLLNFKAAEKRQKLVVKPLKNKDLTIKANKEKLWRVLNNIIVNAIKFSHPDGVIEISIEKLEQTIIIAVADNGIGIPDELKGKIFDMFTETKRAGTSGETPYGLGLSISKQIIEAHQGKLWFDSKPNGGTIFYIELPN